MRSPVSTVLFLSFIVPKIFIAIFIYPLKSQITVKPWIQQSLKIRTGKKWSTSHTSLYISCAIPLPHASPMPHSVPYRDLLRTQSVLSAITDIPVNPCNVQKINPVLCCPHGNINLMNSTAEHRPPLLPSALSGASILLLLIVLTDEDQHCFNPFAARHWEHLSSQTLWEASTLAVGDRELPSGTLCPQWQSPLSL